MKKASLHPLSKKSSFDFYANPTESAAVWVPPAAFVLAGLLSYKLSDKMFDKLFSHRLDKSIEKGTNRFNQYALARAAQARGNEGMPEYKDT